MSSAPSGYEEFAFVHEGKTRRVFRRGEGPGVLIMHELPGMTAACLRLGERIANEGFAVYLPLMFGEVGERALIRNTLRLCVSREFHLLAKRRHSPVTDWLRALCRRIHAERGGRGVGAVGMCLTGAFALTMLLEEPVLAPVVAQPGLPFPAITRAQKSALGIPDEELDAAGRRAKSQNIPVLALRFSEDPVCPRERFNTLAQHLGPQLDPFVINSAEGNPHGIPTNAHAILTEHFVDEEGHPTREALAKVLDLLRRQLKS
jgi:dienelactone hydrolase